MESLLTEQTTVGRQQLVVCCLLSTYGALSEKRPENSAYWSAARLCSNKRANGPHQQTSQIFK